MLKQGTTQDVRLVLTKSRSVEEQRLAAAGFGEYQPLAAGNDEPSMRKNRRIELKLDQR